MKKTLLSVTLLLIMSTMLAQSVTVRFTARSTNGQYHPFESVRVENETQGWSQRIDYPDTVIVLGSSESIDVAEAIKGPQIKVYPNPFAGRTSTELQICEDGEATVSIMRINGSVVSEYNGFLKAGIYRLNVSLAEPQVAFLCVSTRSGRTVAKMVNTATGTADKIDISYLEGYSSQTKAVGIGPFNVGDQMSYNANYTSSNGITTSNTVTQSQTTSELITLFFTESSSTTLPTVTTSTVSNTTSSTATCGGNVTNDGNATVTARGVCWSTSHNPTVSNSHTTDGSGTGSFTSSITGLSANTTYYVRAYATNSAGTAYGEERTFTTSASVSLPTVTTSMVSSITSSSATCGGNVTNSGNATVTARGVCWSTSHNPTVSDSHTTNGSGTGIFTSSMTGLSQNTTYYVRAYATNSAGTAYGYEVSFTTSANVSLPTVTTSSVSSITSSTATCGGNVTNSGNATVTARGVCWSTSHNPTTSNSHTTDGSGTGSFTSSMTGLSQNTTYYVRAYATNSAGTAYGNEVSFTTLSLQLPTVTTSAVSSITANSAACGGNVTSNGNATVTARGVCWSTSHNPTVSNSHTADGSGTGSFTSSMTGLSANTTYYVRAYATNSAGTAYGEERTFTTSIVFDQNGASIAVFTVASGHAVHFSRGNLQYQASTGTWRFAEHQYDTVGSANSNISSSYSGWIDLFGWGTSGWNSGANAYQPWATSTSYSDYYPGGSYTNNLTGAYANADWGEYNRISNGGNQAGMWRTLTVYEWDYLLFSRAASTINGVANARYTTAVVNGTNGLVIFPDNFTMPSGMSYPLGINGSAYFPENINTYTESQWSQMEGAGCIFLPAAGDRDGTEVGDVGTYGFYRSSTYSNVYQAYGICFGGFSFGVNRFSSRYIGQSVRLVRDTTSASVSLPTVTTSTVSSITSSTATCGGNVTNSGIATVTARGVCWSTSHNPTVSNSHTTDGSGTGSFTSSMTGLSQNTTYYVRAYATNSEGTAYGNEVSFTANTSSVVGFDQNGASVAVFTVSEGRRVHFSRGNLQYKASTGTWRFAEHQYDYVGADNRYTSSSYSGWIDLFGWGTSGWNSGANAYQPWRVIQDNSNYWPGGSATNNLTGAYANADWGVYNRISNGGNQAGMWRTLTKDEWSNLLFSRSASTVGGTANARYAKATVNGTSGLIIFPDTFTLPTGMTVTNVNNRSGAFTSNTYTSSQWGQLEAAGCIFLPCAGYRYADILGIAFSNVWCGYYWSSTYYNDDYAYDMLFSDDEIKVYSLYRDHGLSVRLVRD